MREAGDWAWETDRMGPIMKTGERLDVQERLGAGPWRLPGWALC